MIVTSINTFCRLVTLTTLVVLLRRLARWLQPEEDLP